MNCRHAVLIVLAGLVGSCGGSSGSPGAPSTPAVTHPVVVTVFYDDNANGALDAGESARVPEVEVEVAGRMGRSEKLTGRATVAGVPEGSHAIGVRPASLPPFFRGPAANPPSVQSPQPSGGDVYFPLSLPIGQNRPHVYMGFGDSITNGDGARTTDGYKDVLRVMLEGHFGRATIVDQGIGGTKSDAGAERIGDSLIRVRPAYTLILYGTNDWRRLECRELFPCDVVENLRHMIGSVRSVESLPVLGTIIPVNPTDIFGEQRNNWVTDMNNLIRPMARQEGVPLADLHAAFMREPQLSALFTDHVHPNDRGYQLIAAEFFRAITRPAAP